MRKKPTKSKDKHKYIIYRIDDVSSSEKFPKKIILQKFFATDDAEAYAYLKDYKKVANKNFTYYYDEVNEITSINKDGTKKTYADIYEMHEDVLKDKNIFEKLMTELDYRWSKIKDGWYWLKYLCYYIRTGHDYKASWSLDTHLLSEIAWNLKVLKNDKYGCSPVFLDHAREILHKDEKDFNMEEYATKMNYDYSDEEFKLATQLRAEEYDKMIEHIALYSYYSNCGSIDKEFVDDVEEFEKKWKSTLPIKPGTYNSFDYKKLKALEDKHWNKIWEWMRKYGKCLWS